MSYCRDEIASVVNALSDALVVLRNADPADKAQIYAGLGLRLIYQPGERLVRTEVHVSPAQHWQIESARGGLHPNPNACCLTNSELGAGYEPGSRSVPPVDYDRSA